jgi:pimeloyl-ACP methyl ester carboxylesterase
VRDAVGLIVTISVAGLGSLHAQKAACTPAAATADPSPVDTAHPSVTRAVLIPSGDVRLNGLLYMAQGRGVHPTVVFLHGFPGDEKNLGLAQAVRRGEALSREAVTHAAEWSLQRYAGVLAKKKLLLLAATHDEAVRNASS